MGYGVRWGIEMLVKGLLVFSSFIEIIYIVRDFFYLRCVIWWFLVYLRGGVIIFIGSFSIGLLF